MAETYNQNTSITIEDLVEIEKVSDSNMMIIEDDEDTKKTSVKEFKKNLSGDYSDPDKYTFYSSKKTEELLNEIRNTLADKAPESEVESLSNRVADIIASAGTGKDTEIIDARDGQTTLSKRLERDYKNINDNINSINMDLDILTAGIEHLADVVENDVERCGLIEDYGIMQTFKEYTITSSPVSCTVEDSGYEFYRNGIPSKKLYITEDATACPAIKHTLTEEIDVISTVELIFYIDRTTFNNFSDNDGIRIHLSSDNPSIKIANYFTYTITKSEMVQGWNCVKRKFRDFKEVGSPDANAVKSVTVEIGRTDILNGSTIYINSVVFNQKMKPTLLLSFDGFYDNSLNYTYPYLVARNIPATIFLNSRTTLSNQTVDSLIKLRTMNNWDFGMYGCNPNKEILTEDDNYRNQYIALRTAKSWLQDNVLEGPISYSAPYGNLRPLTVPILKDLGFKIARTGANSYCSQFTKKDFAIPMYLMSNDTTLEEITAKIDYAIETGQTISLYTYDVTEYGDESSSKKIMFESVIYYILEKVNAGKLQCLTFSDFYKRCVE